MNTKLALLAVVSAFVTGCGNQSSDKVQILQVVTPVVGLPGPDGQPMIGNVILEQVAVKNVSRLSDGALCFNLAQDESVKICAKVANYVLVDQPE